MEEKEEEKLVNNYCALGKITKLSGRCQRDKNTTTVNNFKVMNSGPTRVLPMFTWN